ncbi:Rieske (2Fe-2S) protein [bacterium]|nr:MAG: Rieske (2Fe-2S) protein [bacterium]
MRRQSFVRLCSLAAAAQFQARLGGVAAAAEAKAFNRVQLVDGAGKPLSVRRLSVQEAYVFLYPYLGTPSFLIHLPAAAAAGAGPERTIVAFSAICAHQLSYPSKEGSPITYSAENSAVAGRSGVIVCCAHNSVYDPAQGAKVVGGPAPQPLATIALEYDNKSGGLYATGVVGPDRFEQFFRAYAEELIAGYGRGQARRLAAGTAAAIPLSEYCHAPLHC